MEDVITVQQPVAPVESERRRSSDQRPNQRTSPRPQSDPDASGNPGSHHVRLRRIRGYLAPFTRLLRFLCCAPTSFSASPDPSKKAKNIDSVQTSDTPKPQNPPKPLSDDEPEEPGQLPTTDMTKSSNVCDTCWKGIVANQFGLLRSQVNQPDDSWPTMRGYQYNISAKTIETNADQGCHWCQLLSQSVSRSDFQSDKEFKIHVTPGVNALSLNMNDRTVWVGYVYTRADDPAAIYVPGRNLFCDVGSEDALSLAKGLMNSCLQHHFKCPQPPARPPMLPTRVVDCSDPSKPYLFVSSAVPDRFVALSYVWGEDRPHKPTKENLNTYVQSIDIALQPQTVRDAIATTHNLGLRYLWIDALCIIQDSDDDKDHELERMRSYYTDSCGKIRMMHPQSVPFILPTGTSIGTISLSSRLITPRSRFYDPSHEPIHKRGWCMQEFFLSPRALIFASHTLQYRCQTETRNIGGADNTRWVSASLEPVRTYDLPKSPETPEEKEKVRSAWNAIIEKYTKRAVSESSDKLVAVSSLAEEFHGIIQSPYLAGLWESQLLTGLLWRKDWPHKLPARPKDYRAPSWSWAAVDGLVNPGNACILDGKQEFVADVVRCQTTLKNARLPFGEVTAGAIVLSAKVEFECLMAPLRAIYRLREANEVTEDGEPIDKNTGRRMEEIGLGQLDSNDEEIPESGHRSVSVVLIYRDFGPETQVMQGIVVEPVTSGNTASQGEKYRRIGFFQRRGKLIDVDEWFTNLEKVEIEIV